MPAPDLLYQGRFLEMVKTRHWEYVRRNNNSGIVCIIAVTKQDELLFIEQFRPPVNRKVIELPAGLAGDIRGKEDESFEIAARRELLEETGYEAEQLRCLGEFATSAGMCDETVTMFFAKNCWQTGSGGGDESENIQIHKILRSETKSWLEAQNNSGQLIDARVLTGLWLLEQIS